jgi:hypothetical protein
LIIDIRIPKVQDFAHPHATSSHEFQHQTVSYFDGAKDDLVDGLFLMNLPTGQFPQPKEFLQYRCIAGIRKLSIQVITDEVEEAFEVGIAGVFG